MTRKREEEIREVAAKMADLMDKLQTAVDTIRARPPAVAPVPSETPRGNTEDEGGNLVEPCK